MMKQVRVIDSHTGGEPTRLIIDGFPVLAGGTMAEKRDVLREQYDQWRRACLLEPRGNDVLVGALCCEPVSQDAVCGVIFFNNAGYLGMCGHGTIGLVASLRHLGRIAPGEHRIDTPVGQVSATLHEDGAVTIANVASYRHRQQVAVDVPGYGRFTGDVAWGGNWFFLVSGHGEDLAGQCGAADRPHMEDAGRPGSAGHTRRERRIDRSHRVVRRRRAGRQPQFRDVSGQGLRPLALRHGHQRKLACLADDGKLAPGQRWVQASITGSRFEGHRMAGRAYPLITGRAS